MLLVSWQPSVRHWFIRRLVRDVCILCIILLSYSWSLLLLWQDSMFIGELFVPEMVVCILLFIVKFLILNQFIVYFFSKFLIQTIVLRCYIWNYIVTCSRIIRTNFPFVDAQNWCYRHHKWWYQTECLHCFKKRIRNIVLCKKKIMVVK